MRHVPETIDAVYVTSGGRLIWTDRISIAVALLIALVLTMFRLGSVAPFAFDDLVTIPEVSLYVAGVLWFVLRLLDFLVTGRIRYCT